MMDNIAIHLVIKGHFSAMKGLILPSYILIRICGGPQQDVSFRRTPGCAEIWVASLMILPLS